jgi:hypothetical protein
MKRHHQILAGILAIQTVLSIIVFWPRSAATGEGTPVFADLKTDDILALSITDGEGSSIALRQVDESWVLPDADDYPADADKITQLLDKIVSITTGRLVTRTAASHKRLQVSPDDFARRLEFQTVDGAKHTLYLGSSPRYGATHFRVDGQDETYLTDAISIYEAEADAGPWIDPAYVSIPDADITRVTLKNANGSFTFTKDEEGNWTMAGLAPSETLNETEVTNTIRKAAALNILTPLGKEELSEYGVDEPTAEVTLDTADTTIIVRIGAQDSEDNSYVIISSESEYYVRVSELSVKDLIETTREDFLEGPPTPTPEEDTSTE